MKPRAAAVLVLSLVLAVAASVLAQTSPGPGSPPAAPARPDTAPPGSRAVEGPPATDDPAALPRAPVERTTILGLSPAAAVLMAASLLVVVILAIVAMTRSNNAYLDLDRRE